jgi:hypothetical protein
MEAMFSRLEPNDQPRGLAEDKPRRNRELVDERCQRMLGRGHQGRFGTSAGSRRWWRPSAVSKTARTSARFPQTLRFLLDAPRRRLGEAEPMSQARTPRKRVTERNELGLEAPMVITPAALVRVLRRILGPEAKR